MRGSVKANLIVFLIIAVIAFCISSAFASFTIHEDNDSYKLIPIEDDSFEPNDINYVPTVKPKNDTNTTNSTVTIALNMPIAFTNQPPAILPNIADPPISRIIKSFFSKSPEKLSPM